MPKLEPKHIQQELEKGLIWPFYWIYGPETLKAKELIKRIKKAVFGQETLEESVASFAMESFDGGECDVHSVLDVAQSLSLLGGVRFILIRDAHLLKNPEALTALFGPPQKKSELLSVCVAVAKDFDARKKFSKALLESAPVIACDEIPEAQRESWITYLAKRRGLELHSSQLMHLSALDPWSLEIIDQELEKFSLAGAHSDVFLQELAQLGGMDSFIDAFFRRDKKTALEHLGFFADQPDQTLPLLGLLTWNVRQLVGFIADRQHQDYSFKANSYLMEKLKRWSPSWTISDLSLLQRELCQLDFSTKQTPLMPLGLWSQLVIRFTSDPREPESSG